LRELKITGHRDPDMRRPSIGAAAVPSSRVTVQNLELSPLDQLQQVRLRLAHLERAQTDEVAWG
jgi:hypothetical protein